MEFAHVNHERVAESIERFQRRILRAFFKASNPWAIRADLLA